jgi:predicted ferric reductase
METSNKPSDWKTSHPDLWRGLQALLAIVIMVAAVSAGYWIAYLASSPTVSGIGSFVAWLLSANTTQVTWYVTRASGLMAYLLLWLSTVWGLAVSSKVLEGKLHGAYTYDFHQFISLLSLGFLGLHLVTLLLDQFLPFSVLQVMIPMLSTYRPIWTAFGTIALYLVALVTVTFYMKGRIGNKAFRAIHVSSLVGYAAAAVHGLFAGTDGALPIVQIMYALTFLAVVFLMVYWIALLIQKRQLAKNAPAHSLPPAQGRRILR